MKVRWTNLASISVAVASYQAVLRPRDSGKDPPGVLTGRAAEYGMLSCLDFLLTPWAKPWVLAEPIGVAQEVGGSQLHLKKACGCVSRE